MNLPEIQPSVAFRFYLDGVYLFSRFVPTENWKRAFEEYQDASKKLGIEFSYQVPQSVDCL